MTTTDTDYSFDADESFSPAQEEIEAAPLEIGTKADEGSRKRIKVNLVGVLYEVRPPKASLGLKLAVRAKQFEDKPELLPQTLNEFIDKAFTKDDAAKIKQRMYEDEEDALDLPHIMSLMETLVEKSIGTPTS